MPIPIKKEPEWVTKETRGLKERCVFCKTPTIYWHEATNNPVCLSCAPVKEVSDIPIK